MAVGMLDACMVSAYGNGVGLRYWLHSRVYWQYATHLVVDNILCASQVIASLLLPVTCVNAETPVNYWLWFNWYCHHRWHLLPLALVGLDCCQVQWQSAATCI